RQETVKFQAHEGAGGHDPTRLKPEQIRDEDRYLSELGSIDDQFERIYRAHRCFAPLVPMGSIILFEHCVLHGSYRTSKMTTPRYSLDCRATSEYLPTKENASYGGVVFRATTYPGRARAPSLHDQATPKS